VDPVHLGIPTYHDVIPKKDARDLRTIRQKLDTDKYDSVEAFQADIDLMLKNAMKFNGAESEVGLISLAFEDRFRALLTIWRSGAVKKRKDGDHGTPQPTKKMKIG
jgi:transcription initiation factor TFIID subunit 2